MPSEYTNGNSHKSSSKSTSVNGVVKNGRSKAHDYIPVNNEVSNCITQPIVKHSTGPKVDRNNIQPQLSDTCQNVTHVANGSRIAPVLINGSSQLHLQQSTTTQNQVHSAPMHHQQQPIFTNFHPFTPYPGAPWRRKVAYAKNVIDLHEEINDFYEFMKPLQEEEFMRNRVVSRIEAVVERIWPNAKVEIFGSFATKLYLPTSDIDLMIMGKWDHSPLYTLKNALVSAQVASESDIKVLDKASVPIIKVTDRETNVRVDISFNTSNGVNSANLIKKYMLQYPSLPKLVLVLKQFLYQRHLNEVFTGGISSYSLILMTISFLQLHPRLDASSERANLGVLLIEFFELYGRYFNYLNVGIRVRDGGSYVPKNTIQEQMDPGYRPSILCIEDPLNPKNDIGKSSYGALNVKKAFDYAYLQLSHVCLNLNSSCYTSPATATNTTSANAYSEGYVPSILLQILQVPQGLVESRETVRIVFGAMMIEERTNNGDE